MERWEPVLGYEGDYAASDQGRIARVSTHAGAPTWKLCKPRKKAGYMIAHLCRDGTAKDVSVHRAVWQAFNGPIPNGFVINHLNGVKNDNRLENLEVCTHSENGLHASRVLGIPLCPHKGAKGSRNARGKLTEADIPIVLRMRAEGMLYREIGAKFGMTGEAIGYIVRGKHWAHVERPG